MIARPKPYCVYGGFRMAYTWWVLEDAGTPSEGWDEQSSFEDLDPTIYPTAAECEAAIIEQHGEPND